MKTVNGLNEEYTVAWLVVGVLALVQELYMPAPWGWEALFWLILGVEALAVANPSKGDTLSEHVWSFHSGMVGRKLLVLGLVGWICFRFAHLGSGISYPRIALVAGLGSWLVVHFWYSGRRG